MTTRTISIAASSTLAVLLVAGSYLAATPGGVLVALHIANAQSSDEVLRAYALKDTDGDGLPDWQEALYGTDPTNASSVKTGITDGEAVTQGLVKPKVSSAIATSTAGTQASVIPGESPAANTLTDQFSQAFFKAYVQASGGQQMSAADQQALINTELAAFTTQAQTLVTSHYSLVSIHTSSNISVSDYAGSVEAVLRKNAIPAGIGDVFTLSQSLVQDNNEQARKDLKTLGQKYTAIVTGLAALQVPPALSKDHLALIQAFDTDAKAVLLVVSYEKDPIAALGSLSVYPQAALSMTTAFKDIATAILAVGEPAEGQPGFSIVRTVRNAEQPKP